jgi:hypothetical protein
MYFNVNLLYVGLSDGRYIGDELLGELLGDPDVRSKDDSRVGSLDMMDGNEEGKLLLLCDDCELGFKLGALVLSLNSIQSPPSYIQSTVLYSGLQMPLPRLNLSTYRTGQFDRQSNPSHLHASTLFS